MIDKMKKYEEARRELGRASRAYEKARAEYDHALAGGNEVCEWRDCFASLRGKGKVCVAYENVDAARPILGFSHFTIGDYGPGWHVSDLADALVKLTDAGIRVSHYELYTTQTDNT